MHVSSLRSALRERTKEAHERLDAAVGQFHDIASYGAYVCHTAAFRASIERELCSFSQWTPVNIAGLVRQDLADLQLFPRITPELRIGHRPAAWKLGAAWVLEGSALGARVLLKRAARLGLSDTFGARHLAALASDQGRWRVFLTVLETSPDSDVEEAVAGATHTFDFALSVYGEKTA